MTDRSLNSEPDNRAKHTRTFWIVSIICVAICIIIFSFVDTKAMHDWARTVPGWLVFAFMAFLPLVGVPVSFTYVMGGARFGAIGGLIAAAFAIAINLLLTYWLTKSVLHRPIAAFFKKTKYRMPQVPDGEYVSVSLLTALIPGLPYTAKNYLLVLAGVPFRFFFWVCLPAHFVHASLGIFFGDMTKDLTTPKIIFLIVYGIVLTLLCRRVVKRLLGKSSKSPKTADEKLDYATSKS
jgi:uncharacterized membrane protein YdjX (TVP38/TMEM64 family)